MTTRRSRFERGARLSRYEMQKVMEERKFVKSLTDARDALNDIIDDVTMGRTEDVVDALAVVDTRLNRAHRHAQELDGER